MIRTIPSRPNPVKETAAAASVPVYSLRTVSPHPQLRMRPNRLRRHPQLRKRRDRLSRVPRPSSPGSSRFRHSFLLISGPGISCLSIRRRSSCPPLWSSRLPNRRNRSMTVS